jgi:hypothetical protein
LPGQGRDPANRWVEVADETGRVRDVGAGEERAAFRWPVDQVRAVAVAPDGMTAAAGANGGVVIWDVDEP